MCLFLVTKAHSSDFNNREKGKTMDIIIGQEIGEYRTESLVARGTNSTIYRGTHLLMGEEVCLKRYDLDIKPAIPIGEADVLSRLQHTEIPKFRNLLSLKDDSYVVVTHFVSGSPLGQAVQKHGNMDPEIVASFLERMLHLLRYMHVDQRCVHGDIKPEHILARTDHSITLVGFGVAEFSSGNWEKNRGWTDLFAPPEQVEGRPLVPQMDLYALGMSMVYLLCGGNEEQFKNGEIPDEVPDPMGRFLSRLVMKDPAKRLNWTQMDLFKEWVEIRFECFK